MNSGVNLYRARQIRKGARANIHQKRRRSDAIIKEPAVAVAAVAVPSRVVGSADLSFVFMPARPAYSLIHFGRTRRFHRRHRRRRQRRSRSRNSSPLTPLARPPRQPLGTQGRAKEMRKSFHRPFPLIGARLLYLLSRHIVAQNATTANGLYSALPLFPSLPQREEEEPHRHRPTRTRTPSSRPWPS